MSRTPATTAEEVRHAERRARFVAQEYADTFKRPDVDPFSRDHAIKMFRLWSEAADVHREYAASLEQAAGQGRAA